MPDNQPTPTQTPGNPNMTPIPTLPYTPVSTIRTAPPRTSALPNPDLDRVKPGREIIGEVGGTGTYIFGGYLAQQDYNTDLIGRSRIDIYDQMRKGDATVRAIILAIMLPLMSANWYIQEASDNSKDIAAAEHIEDQLFNGHRSWTSFLREALLYLVYGNYNFEKIFNYTDKGLIGWEKFAPRLPKTVLKWQIGSPPNAQFGITQILPTGGQPEIPEWKLLILVNEQEGENYEGQSILRTAYKHWWYKEGYYRVDALAQERQGLGIPYFLKPPGAADVDIKKMRELMQNLRANEQAYLEAPVGWVVDFMDMKAKSIKDPMPMIEHQDRQISKAVLAQFLSLGASRSSGSRALSEDQSDLFLLSIQAVAKYVQEVIQKKAINQLVDLNFEVEEYPKLEMGKVGFTDFAKLADAINKLQAAGMITSNYETEKYLRSVMDLPDLDEDEYNGIAEAEKQQEADRLKEIKETVANQSKPVTGSTIVKDSAIAEIIKFRKRLNHVIKNKVR